MDTGIKKENLLLTHIHIFSWFLRRLKMLLEFFVLILNILCSKMNQEN